MSKEKKVLSNVDVRKIRHTLQPKARALMRDFVGHVRGTSRRRWRP